jgi:hypothetical protein
MELNKEQIEWLDKCTGKSPGDDYETWVLNPETGLVDVKGSFNCSKQNLKDFKGVRFGGITKHFDCRWNSLTTLEGAPQKVGWGFNCSKNSLTSLEGGPQKVGWSFYCGNNSLTTLEGGPQKVGMGFFCDDNSLTTLEGGPQKLGAGFHCGGNPVPAKLLKCIWGIMYDKEVPYLIALGIYKKEVKGSIDSRLLTECIPEETIKGASLLTRSLS